MVPSSSVHIVLLWGCGHYSGWCLCLLWFLGLLNSCSTRNSEGFPPPSRFLFCWHVFCLEPRQWVLSVLNVSIFIWDASDATIVRLPRGCRATYAIVLRFSIFLRQHSIRPHDSRKMLVRLPYDCRKTNHKKWLTAAPAWKLANSYKIVSQSCGCLVTALWHRYLAKSKIMPKKRRNNVHVKNSVCDLPTFIIRTTILQWPHGTKRYLSKRWS